MAARPTPLKFPGQLAPAHASAPTTVEALGQQLREVLPTRRLHSVSLCDHEANVLWLSEGALGPDEHVLMVEAIEQLSADTALPCHETALEDGRLAVFLPVRAPTGKLVGVAMILADSKSVGDDTLERMTAAPVRTIMHRLAVLLRPAGANDADEAVIPMVELELVSESDPAAEPESDPPAAEGDATGSETIITAAQIADILQLEIAPDQPPPVPAFSQPKPPSSDFPAASDEDLVTEFEMVHLEFVLEPPVVNAAPAPAVAPARAAAPIAKAAAVANPTPVPAPTPARVTVVSPKPARVLPPPSPQAARPAPRPFPRRPAPAPAPAAPTAAPAPVSSAPVARAAAPVPKVVPVARPAPVVTPAPVAPAPVAAPAPPAPAAVAPAAQVAEVAVVPSGAASDASLLLELLPFAKLRTGGQSRRFQVQARSGSAQRDPAAQDALILQRLLSWLAANRATWNSQPTSFTVNLSITTLEDERFPQKIAAALNANGIAAETVGFEIAEALCAQRRALVERFITQCEKLGSWVVIDDFSFDSQVMPLLRSRALRVLKLDPRLTSAALRDKLSQAVVVATVQAAKVLGIHCAAKKVDSQASLQWLTAIGCDFAQGAALGHPLPLEALGA